ncbi:probable hexosyltransferase MUCI70 [Impatiens glandulifera]|uniref:probable hexosyltransferase MUCI70 n=1 Tax=Impatiens glandulifera TaxID=253017 RepID=UPI001FB11008|nr:probable hexosyltransferase MUCI70 [Impatiens glandulifera]
MFNNNISIPVSDDDSDDAPSRTQVRVRRKRRKSSFRGKDEFLRRFVRNLLRWWPALLFLPAAGLLLFEASRIGRRPNSLAGHSEQVPQQKQKSIIDKKPGGNNLNRDDRITRSINGVKTPCLDLLPERELQLLDIPPERESSDTIKEIMYLSDINMAYVEQNNASRFNLFTGSQTLDQREKSFKANETVMLNCGFYSDKGGFKISEEDKYFLQNCEVAVSTCAFGGGDNLYQPIGMTEASLKKVCYVAFWDEITLAAQELEGRKIAENRFIGKWRIVVVMDLPFSDQRLNGKIPKMLSHRLFPRARYSIWVDSKSQFRRDPLGVLETVLWRKNSVLAISEHGARSSVYDEAKAVVKKNKAKPEEVEVQLNQYRIDGFPEDKRFNGKKALAEASVIVREHTAITNMLMCVWFNEVVRFTSRDQLSFPYVLWRLNVLKGINMFPVCTRKDLVNSMGHLRKARPRKELVDRTD